MLGSPSSLYLSLKRPGSYPECPSNTTHNSGALFPLGLLESTQCVSIHLILANIHLPTIRLPKRPPSHEASQVFSHLVNSNEDSVLRLDGSFT